MGDIQNQVRVHASPINSGKTICQDTLGPNQLFSDDWDKVDCRVCGRYRDKPLAALLMSFSNEVWKVPRNKLIPFTHMFLSQHSSQRGISFGDNIYMLTHQDNGYIPERLGPEYKTKMTITVRYPGEAWDNIESMLKDVNIFHPYTHPQLFLSFEIFLNGMTNVYLHNYGYTKISRLRTIIKADQIFFKRNFALDVGCVPSSDIMPTDGFPVDKELVVINRGNNKISILETETKNFLKRFTYYRPIRFDKLLIPQDYLEKARKTSSDNIRISELTPGIFVLQSQSPTYNLSCLATATTEEYPLKVRQPAF